MLKFSTNKNNGLHLFWAAAALFFSTFSSSFAAEIVGIRFGVTSPTETRLVFDSKGSPDYQIDATATASGAGVLVFSFPHGSIASQLRTTGKGAGHAADYLATRGGATPAVTVTLRNSAKIKQVFVIAPSSGAPNHRLVVDLVSAPVNELVASIPGRKFDNLTEVIAAVAPPATPAVAAPATPEVSAPSAAGPAIGAEVASLPPVSFRPVIVIDAGHGGTDPGAAGQDGAKESAATLAAALALADILKSTGRYEVVLTRSKDVRLAHEERSRIARDAKAELFISLHADAHSDKSVRGGSVYTLSDEGTERSAREALAKGNYNVFDLDIGAADREVGGILYGLAQRRTANESDRFAEFLIAKLAGVTPLLNNTHRRGNFKVLLAPDVPAVLLELAFISNKLDETNLQSPAWRKRSMGAAAAAIDAYFQQRAASKHASNEVSPAEAR